MPFLDPYDFVIKTISLQRWEKEAIKRYRGINFSGLIQEKVTLPLIKEREPNIFSKFTARKIEITN